MCGIAGILTREVRGDELERVGAMQRALRHRGPDDEGTWQSPSRQATFGHARLSIIDPSIAGRQPMSTADGRFTINFNGEIYNFKELRRTLQSQGVVFRTGTDTEVILRAYEAYGDECVRRLRGMFAFAIWDEQEQTCLLARDRFGIKPLYYFADGGRLMFASEVRALLQSGAVPRTLDTQALYEYFRAGSVQDPRTLLSAVRNLEAGHLMTWDGDIRSRKYWELSFATEPAATDAEPLASALKDSVRHHLTSDVPLGVFLSGGIDSTCLLALATQAGARSLRTVTVSVTGADHDESSRARRTAAHFGTCHEEYRLDGANGRRLFTEYLAAMDQPSIDGLNTYAASRFARERGMQVMLSGIGADELFGGYPSFTEVPRLTRWRRRLGSGGTIHQAASNMLSATPNPRFRRLADLIAQPPGVAASYAVYRGIFARSEANILARRYGGAGGEEVTAPDVDATAADQVSRLELTRYARNQLLRDSDVMSMASGVELRTPFLDNAVVAAATRVPAAQRLKPKKGALVESVDGLPDGIIHRPKRPFQFPFEEWLDGEWRHTFDAVERVGPVSTVTWYRKWCVMVVEHWLTNVVNGGRSWT
jgi:asparagine synthase (glutamine-hydrolysing)